MAWSQQSLSGTSSNARISCRCQDLVKALCYFVQKANRPNLLKITSCKHMHTLTSTLQAVLGIGKLVSSLTSWIPLPVVGSAVGKCTSRARGPHPDHAHLWRKTNVSMNDSHVLLLDSYWTLLNHIAGNSGWIALSPFIYYKHRCIISHDMEAHLPGTCPNFYR